MAQDQNNPLAGIDITTLDMTDPETRAYVQNNVDLSDPETKTWFDSTAPVAAPQASGSSPQTPTAQPAAAPVGANIEALRSQKETIPQFWDTETPVQGMVQADEDEFIRQLNDPNISPEDVAKYTQSKGFTTNPKDIETAREQSKVSGLPIGSGGYARAPVTVANTNDGATGAAARGFGSGALVGGLDELGAVVDTLGGTDERENIWNSDRRLADIWYDNQRKNSAILSNDRNAHGTAQFAGELAGGLVIPFGARAKTVGELASVGAAYGGAHGFLGTDGSYADRARGALIESGIGALGGAAIGKLLQYGGKYFRPKATGELEEVTPTAEEAAEAVNWVPNEDGSQTATFDGYRVNARPKEDAPTKLTRILKEAEPLNKEQKAIYSAERSRRVREGVEAAKLSSGEAGFHTEKGALKGEMEKVSFEPQREKFTQDEVNELFDSVKNDENLSFYDSIAAREGLSKLMEGRVPTPSELDKLKTVFGDDFVKSVARHRDKVDSAFGLASDVLTLPRALQSTLDMSAPLRQGINLIGTKNYWKSFYNMFRQAKSEDVFNMVQNGIKERETYPLMERAGLAITDIGSDISRREEAFASRFAEKIPGVKFSERAYTGFLNQLRADTFDDLVRKSVGAGMDVDNPEALQKIARYVNAATGRGNLYKPLQEASTVLNSLFFSPRLMASRIQTFNPLVYTQLPPGARQEALKQALAFGGIATSVLGLAKAAGADVEADPRSSDFAKAKVGETRYDMLGGFSQYLTFAARLATAETKTLKGDIKPLESGFGKDSRLDVTNRFFENKFSPVAGFVRDYLQGADPSGKKFDLPTSVVNSFVPMILKDTADLMAANGPSGAAMAVPAVFGVGVSTYEDKKEPQLLGVEKDDPLNKEIDRLTEIKGDRIIDKPRKSLSVDGKQITLDDEDYAEYSATANGYLVRVLKDMTADPDYQALSDEEKLEVIKEVKSEVRKEVRDHLFNSDTTDGENNE